MTPFAPAVLPADGVAFPLSVSVLIVGAGAAGLTAALATREAGAEVLVLERDAAAQGSTALSSGLVPAAGTRFQAARGISDTPELFARDIQAKAKGLAEPRLVAALASSIGPTVEWLADRHDVPFDVAEGFLYPGHSVLRMHGTPRRTGSELMACLGAAAARAGVDVVTDAHVHALVVRGDRVVGVRIDRPDGSVDAVGCAALVLACSGFGGNRELVRRHMPEMAGALFFGHAGNQGDAVAWGTALGAATRDMGAYQGHGSVATPHNVLITWALMMEGGFQVNAAGERFSNEHQGYSEQARAVLAQPGGVAWNIYDERQHILGLEFQDYRDAVAAGAVHSASDIGALARALGLPEGALAATLQATRAIALGEAADGFGRDFSTKPPLAAPFHGVKVTGALFHTQGGLLVDGNARVLRADGTALPNLFAAGGAACGVSGPECWGYLSGNGLLAAIGLGRMAGRTAATRL
ncbi:MAG: FAD-dependent oxidoreductase [Alphaproteobacteria bacterium]|nr:FAD-dependent oxidoreductase [Alphaproteobacteria bacterium]